MIQRYISLMRQVRGNRKFIVSLNNKANMVNIIDTNAQGVVGADKAGASSNDVAYLAHPATYRVS